MKATPELLKALDIMLSGKSRRLTPEGKKIIGSNKGAWWMIGAIHSDETITICSETHTIFERIPLTSIKL